MIFFSDDILNNIIDESSLDELLDKVNEFNENNKMIFTYFNYGIIDIDYIQNLLNHNMNKIAYYCIDNSFDIRNCPSCMIYSKQYNENSNEIIYYIFLISTQYKFRKLGYATMLLNGFIEMTKKENINKKDTNVKIVLSSLDEVVSYYQNYGFEVVDYTLENYPYLMQFEKYDETKMYTIMEFLVLSSF